MQLQIANIGITQDTEGRYCLNDLHRAAGGEKKHGPSYWMANAQTQELVAELGHTGNPVGVINDGFNNGTYVCKELVYSYAMWISPKFNLQVIRAYDAMTAPKFDIPKTLSSALYLAAEQARTIEAQTIQIADMTPKADFFDAVTGSTDAIDIGSAAKVLNLGIGRTRLFEFLRNEGILMGDNKPYQKHVDAGHFRVIEQKFNKPDGSTHINLKTVVYQKGLDLIRRRIAAEGKAIQ